MKPLILLLVLLVGCREGRAQDTAYGGSRFDTVRLFSIDTGRLFYNIDTGYRKPDTIKVLMLCADTTRQKFSGSNILRKADGYTLSIRNVNKYYIHWVWWQYGYIVKQWSITEYLGEKKTPLAKEIVVWQIIYLHNQRGF